MSPRASLVRPRFGVHVSAEGGLHRAAERAVALGCETVQVFSRSPRMWRAAPLDAEIAASFRETLRAHRIAPAIIHTMYLINLASEDRELRAKSIEVIAEDLRRAHTLGCEYVVTHLGSRKGMTPSAARKRVVGALDRVLRDSSGSSATLLLENAAGQGAVLGSDFTELARLREGVGRPERVGFAIDTAHCFAAGFDVRSTAGVDEALAPLAERGLLGELRLVHLNDSKTELGSRHDRHEHIGKGRIGSRGLAAVIAHPALRGLPMILETPVEAEGDDLRNLRRARRLAAGVV